MYGYFPPSKPEFDKFRLIVSEKEIDNYLRQHPRLTRSEVLDCLLKGRPSRHNAELLLCSYESSKFA